MDFQTRYQNLNDHQREAVDHIDGPLLVVAGPGTGKTELLSMRTANILKSTDTLPSSILCLTFTDSGAAAMRKRLTEIIGADAYKVAIHTFHSFGTETIGQNAEYFYRGARMQPADELARYEILREIFDELDYTNVLASKNGEEYTYLKDTLQTISDLKRSGLTSEELRLVLDDAERVIDAVENDLRAVFEPRISKSTAEKLAPIAQKIASLDLLKLPPAITPYMNIFSLSIAHAVDESLSSGSTKPITTWKNTWIEKNDQGQFIFKDHKAIDRLRSVAHIYYEYLRRMEAAELYDYDDMILQVVHALETHPDLAANLREKYLYIMVDEFQDTNLAQLRILFDLTAGDEHANIMAVGDDDQGIYSFQGADVSNIHRFRHAYGEPPIIVLTDNYRSTAPILEHARSVITQADGRLEDTIDGLSKQLASHHTGKKAPSLTAFTSPDAEREHVAAQIEALIQKGTAPSDIAILARRHHELVNITPHLSIRGIAINYERRDNALEHQIIRLIEHILLIIDAIHTSEHERADSLLPEILGSPALGYTPVDVWRLSLAATRNHKGWMETMLATPVFQPLALWLIDLAANIHDMAFEEMIDTVIGVPKQETAGAQATLSTSFSEGSAFPAERETSKVVTSGSRVPEEKDGGEGSDNEESTFRSPLYAYYFSSENLAKEPDAYLDTLEALRTVRDAMREHSAHEEPSVASFLDFLSAHRELGSTLTTIRHRTTSEQGAINLLTAHKAKGLEYDHVFIIGLVNSAWGERVRTRAKLIRYPANLEIGTPGDSYDERIRLAYVAMTRARKELSLSYYQGDSSGKEMQVASFLSAVATKNNDQTASVDELTREAELAWRARLAAPISHDMHTLLAPTLESYKLSATHLGNFLDIASCGPERFLLNNLLRFPQAKSPSAQYGTAIHTTLQQAHDFVRANHTTQPIEDIIGNFEHILEEQYLSGRDHEIYLARGIDALNHFLTKEYSHFKATQRTEVNFAGQDVFLGQAHLTGALDLADINDTEKTIRITDYKTGKPSRSWTGKTEYEKIKLHKYHQQLMFYQLLVENSRDYSKYHFDQGVLQFVEPTASGDIIALENVHNSEELAEFRTLIAAVWHCITTLTLPDISEYAPTLKGIIDFERSLIDKYDAI